MKEGYFWQHLTVIDTNISKDRSYLNRSLFDLQF